MKPLKNETYLCILEAARKEFSAKGFKNASMRTIAKTGGVSLSNIYNYFESKDQIFREILTPLITHMYRVMDENHTQKETSFEWVMTDEYQEEMTDIFLNMTEKYRTEFLMLLYQSQGSSLENFMEQFVDRTRKSVEQYFHLMQENYPGGNFRISDFFISLSASMRLTVLGEMIRRDLSRKQIREFLREYMLFSTSGWKGLIGI